jgi:hypothetical protein
VPLTLSPTRTVARPVQVAADVAALSFGFVRLELSSRDRDALRVLVCDEADVEVRSGEGGPAFDLWSKVGRDADWHVHLDGSVSVWLLPEDLDTVDALTDGPSRPTLRARAAASGLGA